MTKPIFTIISLIIFLIPIFFTIPSIYGEKLEELGVVNELLVSGDDTIYFFERDMSIKNPTWIPDTKVMIHHEGKTAQVSDSLFIFPTELTEHNNSLFFAALSPQCLNMITCDYQDVIRMSKIDGSYEKIIESMKSAIHISVEDQILFVSESNGRIWKLNHDGYAPKIIFQGSNIIMDLASNDETVYWLEEEADMKSYLMRQISNDMPEIIKSELKIPYNLNVLEDITYWNDIQIKAKNGIEGEFNIISKLEDNQVKIIDEFRTSSPVTKGNTFAHYGPYLIYGDFIILSNNTGQPTIQLIDLKQDNTFNLKEISDYKPRYLKTGTNNLYVVGENEKGFIIEKIALPIPIPEFSHIMLGLIVVISMTAMLFTTKKFPIN